MERSIDSEQTDLPAEDPPQCTPRPAIWADVPDEKWNDWRWQLSHRLNTLEELQQVIHLTPEEEEGVKAQHRFRLDITPYFAGLIDPDDPTCPIRRQVIPTARELQGFEAAMVDPLGEEAHTPVPGLVHRYPDRVLMLVTTQCASYCRYCTRSRIVGDPKAQFSRADYDAQIDYIAHNPVVRDVLISGGDPLILPQHLLEDLLRRLRAIPHVEVLRIGTRVPVFLPQRVDENLVSMLRRYHPLWMNIHFNHAREITPEVRRACELLADAGIPLGCQSVLLAGINDCPNVMKELVHELVKIRVRPYYIYQCDLVPGAGHFRTPVSKGIEIIESLRGHTSGFAVPTYVVDAPGGGGKIPVMPQYVISQSDHRVVLRNFEGFITTYTEPTDYPGHDASRCPACQRRLAEGGQMGVAGLLAGQGMTIVPEGFEQAHQRLTRIRWNAIQLVPTGGEEA
ncbi:MAG: lysine 2,3-aminomutase [Anaerolineae bacterium]|jgi:lysine 2,3-aminomutase|nr:lysine 2,3-aminomutase [Anaerolineae bacterium]MDH7474703.1 lysine 2,3-aminomutase [Anaerolineae bacterium]